MLFNLSNRIIQSNVILTFFLVGNADNPDFISSIGRPFIPPLPEGVFPGSRLFFPHFESLGVNTCALHDLRNRFVNVLKLK